MLRLPMTLPEEIRSEFEARGAPEALDEALRVLVEIFRETFGARFAIGAVQAYACSSRDRMEFHVKAADPEEEILAEQLLDCWKREQLGTFIRVDLERRLAPVAYSAYSWPYPVLKLPDALSGKIEFPFPSSWLLPFSSALLPRLDHQQAFFGYCAFLFEDSQSLNDALKQVVLSLPQLLSSVIAAELGESVQLYHDAGAYAHNVKHYLMVAADVLEGIRRGKLPPSDRALLRIDKALKQMLIETNSMLLTDKDDAGHLHIVPMAVPVNELVREALAELGPLFEGARVNLRSELATDLPPSPIDPAIFPTVINNLLDNALKYSPAEATVVVRTRRDGSDAVALEVTNPTAGLSAAERELIFSRHYRAENSRGKPGNGLGLYLVRRVVEAHRGEVSLDTSKNSELTFVVRIPVCGDQDTAGGENTDA